MCFYLELYGILLYICACQIDSKILQAGVSNWNCMVYANMYGKWSDNKWWCRPVDTGNVVKDGMFTPPPPPGMCKFYPTPLYFTKEISMILLNKCHYCSIMSGHNVTQQYIFHRAFRSFTANVLILPGVFEQMTVAQFCGPAKNLYELQLESPVTWFIHRWALNELTFYLILCS